MSPLTLTLDPPSRGRGILSPRGHYYPGSPDLAAFSAGPAPRASSTPLSDPVDGTRELRVLVIDDDQTVREMLCQVLGHLGHDPRPAADGSEGIQQFEQGRYDLVITDLAMPGLSGWDVVERLRQVDQAARLIILTGAATGADTERARAAGIRLLQKPIPIDDLRAAVDGAVTTG